MTSASTIVAPQTRDLDILAGSLSTYLGARITGSSNVRIMDLKYPLGAGMSHETILFDAEWTEGAAVHRRGLVVRIKPSSALVYLDDMFEEQYRLLKLMHDSSDVRIAEPLWFEPSGELLGAPFFVMEKVAGRVAVSYPPYSRQGWLVDDATPADRRRMWEDAVTQLALIQRVAVPEFLAQPGQPTGFEQEIDRWRRYLGWIDEANELHLLRAAFDRLLAAIPANRPEGIVWGDARLGNMMIGADFRVAAVMDWEQPSQGGALHDLGWWLLSDRNATVNQGIALLEGMGTEAETIALWEAVSGKSAADIDWYIAFTIFKQECLATNMSRSRDMSSKIAPFTPGSRISAALDTLGL